MTTYIDLLSLGPTVELAEARGRALGLEGQPIPSEEMRMQVLVHCRERDAIIIGPSSYNFWRLVPPTVSLIPVDNLKKTYPIRERFKGKLEHFLVQEGMHPKIARKLLSNKSKKSRLWREKVEEEIRRVYDVPPLEEGEEEEKEKADRPYEWAAFDGQTVAYLFFDWAIADSRIVGVDVETDIVGGTPNEMRDKLVGVGVYCNGIALYGSWEDGRWRGLVETYLPQVKWVGHNAKYDLTVLRRHGVEASPPVGDGMLAAYLLGTPSASLKKLVEEMYGYRMTTYEEVTAGRRISEVPIGEVAAYCCDDAYWGVRVEEDLRGQLSEKQLGLYYKTDLPLVDTVSRMEMRGIRVDREQIIREDGRLEVELLLLKKRIEEEAKRLGFRLKKKKVTCKECRNGKNKRLLCSGCNGEGQWEVDIPFNPGSDHDIRGLLFETLNLPVIALTGKTKQPSVASLVLLKLRGEHEVVEDLVEYSRKVKEKGFYKSWLKFSSEEDPYLHTILNTSKVKGGRFSSSDPNLQQVKLDWRGVFVA